MEESFSQFMVSKVQSNHSGAGKSDIRKLGDHIFSYTQQGEREDWKCNTVTQPHSSAFSSKALSSNR